MANPLKVTGKGRSLYYWPAPFGAVKQKIVPDETQSAETPPAEPGAPGGNDVKTTNLGAGQIPPVAMVGIIHELLKEDSTPLDALTVQLQQELHLFILTYHLDLPARNAPTPATPGGAATPAFNPAAPNP
jgi:hypothetical protein